MAMEDPGTGRKPHWWLWLVIVVVAIIAVTLTMFWPVDREVPRDDVRDRPELEHRDEPLERRDDQPGVEPLPEEHELDEVEEGHPFDRPPGTPPADPRRPATHPSDGGASIDDVGDDDASSFQARSVPEGLDDRDIEQREGGEDDAGDAAQADADDEDEQRRRQRERMLQDLAAQDPERQLDDDQHEMLEEAEARELDEETLDAVDSETLAAIEEGGLDALDEEQLEELDDDLIELLADEPEALNDEELEELFAGDEDEPPEEQPVDELEDERWDDEVADDDPYRDYPDEYPDHREFDEFADNDDDVDASRDQAEEPRDDQPAGDDRQHADQHTGQGQPWFGGNDTGGWDQQADDADEFADEADRSRRAFEDYRDRLDELGDVGPANAAVYSAAAAQQAAEALYLMSAGTLIPRDTAADQRDDIIDAADNGRVTGWDDVTDVGGHAGDDSRDDDSRDEDDDRREPDDIRDDEGDDDGDDGDEDDDDTRVASTDPPGADDELPPEPEDWTVWLDVADWLRAVQEQRYPELAGLVDEVEDAAADLDPDVPDADQIDELVDFYEAVEMVLEEMALESEGRTEGLI